MTKRHHISLTRHFFTILRREKLYLSPPKCFPNCSSLDLLGGHIDDDGLHVDPSKLDKIRNWPTPTCPKDILRFMGIANFCAEHFPYLAVKAALLTDLTGKAP